jgi:hypothetical protein
MKNIFDCDGFKLNPVNALLVAASLLGQSPANAGNVQSSRSNKPGNKAQPVQPKSQAGEAQTPNWMDWGQVGDGIGNPAGSMLLLRQMLPDVNFKQSLFETRVSGDEAQALGDYFPRSRYMSLAEFEKQSCTKVQ